VVTFIGADFFQDRSSIIIATEFMDFYSLKDIAAQCGNFFSEIFLSKKISQTSLFAHYAPHTLDNMPLSHAHTRLCIQVHTCLNARNICEYHIPLLFAHALHTQEEEDEEMLPQVSYIIINYNSLVIINHNSLIIIIIM
jgi:hypothetical protein